MTNLEHISLVLFFVIINRIQSIEHQGNCSCDALKARTGQIEEIEFIECRNMSIVNSDIDPDLLCLNPTVKRIELQGNFIQCLHLNADCLSRNPNQKSKLELLNLESNQITQISRSNIAMFNLLKLSNPDFKVNLKYNPFICDCNLLPFFQWIRTAESSEILVNKTSLTCLHPNSMQFQFRRTIYNSELDNYCEVASDDPTGEDLNIEIDGPVNKKQSYVPFRTYRPRRRTTNSPLIAHHVKFSFARFLVVFVLTLFIVATIFFLCTTNLTKYWRKWKQGRYKHFQNYNEDGTDINCVQLSNINLYENSTPSIQFRSEDSDVYFSPTVKLPKQGIATRVMNYLSRVANSKRHHRNLDERDPVYLNSESDRMPDQLYRKYDKEDYKDEFFVDAANNIRPNPFIVHLM